MLHIPSDSNASSACNLIIDPALGGPNATSWGGGLLKAQNLALTDPVVFRGNTKKRLKEVRASKHGT